MEACPPGYLCVLAEHWVLPHSTPSSSRGRSVFLFARISFLHDLKLALISSLPTLCIFHIVLLHVLLFVSVNLAQGIKQQLLHNLDVVLS